MTHLMRRLILAVVVSMGWVGVAAAVPTLTFNIPSQSASTEAGNFAQVSYDGTPGGTLKGAAILVDSVTGTGTPSNDGVTATCVACFLTFETGPFSSSTASSWTFGGGGSITLEGGVDFPDATPDIFGPVTLFLGSWSPFPTVIAGGPFLKIAGAGFLDTKNAGLTAFYGIPDGSAFFGGLGLFFSAPESPPGAFGSTSISSGLVTNAVSEPPVIALFGAMLVGLGIWGRKIRQRGRPGVQDA